MRGRPGGGTKEGIRARLAHPSPHPQGSPGTQGPRPCHSLAHLSPAPWVLDRVLRQPLLPAAQDSADWSPDMAVFTLPDLFPRFSGPMMCDHIPTQNTHAHTASAPVPTRPQQGDELQNGTSPPDPSLHAYSDLTVKKSPWRQQAAGVSTHRCDNQRRTFKRQA